MTGSLEDSSDGFVGPATDAEMAEKKAALRSSLDGGDDNDHAGDSALDPDNLFYLHPVAIGGFKEPLSMDPEERGRQIRERILRSRYLMSPDTAA